MEFENVKRASTPERSVSAGRRASSNPRATRLPHTAVAHEPVPVPVAVMGGQSPLVDHGSIYPDGQGTSHENSVEKDEYGTLYPPTGFDLDQVDMQEEEGPTSSAENIIPIENLSRGWNAVSGFFVSTAQKIADNEQIKAIKLKTSEVVAPAWTATTAVVAPVWDNTCAVVAPAWEKTVEVTAPATGLLFTGYENTCAAGSALLGKTKEGAVLAKDKTSGVVAPAWVATTSVVAPVWDKTKEGASSLAGKITDGWKGLGLSLRKPEEDKPKGPSMTV
mmetsp:Transcript_6824/g.14792  ORF Transcript_6824/g.14792 Transcript_6824/m.14792 type:complete len:277 (-) Transcript_6824:112-942(-)|eukprot:CAMPEP_0173193804 /NCGR_PEP_ID=MMETSP1141-20130122/14155_1 /TAXON_ID=483371 /ORGANISM="non described non described, Strain CCMP2298" /LENGTH=276 /DNA_ID=CAMNT_0014118167 /DNA_START=158 /DNA_END=988 /DNA_ORIENTATION=+